jgi:hypothetical protein
MVILVYLIMKTTSNLDPRRVVIVHWKQNRLKPFEVYSNLKNFSLAHPEYSYDTLNNYLGKKGLPFENEEVRVERKHIITKPENSKPNLPKRLFWELDYEQMDWQKNAEIVIERVVERGTLEEWQELINFYGKKKVVLTLKNKTTYLTDRATKKVCDYFELKPEDLKCYIRKQSRPQHWI